MEALEQAIDRLGGLVALASAIGVSGSAPSMWKKRRNVPAKHCPAIERATGGAIRCEDLRPDVDWAYLRGTNSANAPELVGTAGAPEPTPQEV